jgi:hypothetical protein
MNENEVKKLVVGQLLEALRIIFPTTNLMPKGGEEFKTLSFLENEIFNAIKGFAGMPKKEEIGVFVADEYVKICFDFAAGEISRDEALNKIVGWKSDTKDSEVR